MSHLSEPLDRKAVQAAWQALAAGVRTAVLLTMREGLPFGSHVPYVFGDDWTRAYLHLSRLALHTRHLLQDARLSLFISEPDGPEKNPLALRRMNLQGTGAVLSPDCSAYATVKARYLSRFPQSAIMFGFADFDVWELQLHDAHVVLGFGQAYLCGSAAPLEWIHQKPEQKRQD